MPGKDTAGLVPFSDLVELGEKKAEAYVEFSIVPGKGLTILIDSTEFEVCQVELAGMVLVGYQKE